MMSSFVRLEATECLSERAGLAGFGRILVALGGCLRPLCVLAVCAGLGTAVGCGPATVSSGPSAAGDSAGTNAARSAGSESGRSPGTSTGKSRSAAGADEGRDAPAGADVPDDAFASIEQAVAEMSEAAEQRDSERRLRASTWLAGRGADAVPALAGVLDSASVGTAPKIAACRVLGRIGPPAVPTLLAHLDSDDPLVRINALNQLPHIEPPSRQILDALLATLDHEDLKMRQQAIRGIAQLGTAAKDAAPQLQEILNSKQNDTLRGEAKKALQRVDPRRTLTFD